MEKISGIGIDIVDIKRFKEKNYEDNKIFYEKIFVKSEIDYCLKFKNSEQHFAGKFAIKEAVKKSIDRQIDFLEIVTDHQNSRPVINLGIQNSYKFLTSVSHEKDFAIAIVINQ